MKIIHNLRPGSNVVSADNIAATVKASEKQPHSFASINVLEREGSKGSSACNKKHALNPEIEYTYL